MILTVPQTLKLLQISRTTLYRMFENGELKKVKLSKSARAIRVQLPTELEQQYSEQIKALN